MTLPSEGINPWRATGLPNGTAPAQKPQYANLPDGAKIAPDGTPETDADALTADGGKEFKAFGDDGFTFWDLVDVVNPLQHIPVVSTLYRDLTDDTLDPAPRVMGDTLYMGPIGLVASVANVMVEHNTGKDVGSHVMAYFRDESAPLSAPTATANAGPAAAGTDGTAADGAADPVTEWAQAQTAYYQADPDPVSQWAQAQNAYYRAGATQTQTAAAKPATQAAPAAPAATDTVAQWAQAQNAYYRNGAVSGATQVAEAGPVAAGTDGIDVTAWAAEQTAYYRGGAATQQAAIPAAAGTDGLDVSDWAAEQVAYYQAGPAGQQAQASTGGDGNSGMDVAQWAAEQAAYYQAGTASAAADDPVAAWAQSQTAYYRAGSDDRARPTTAPAAPSAVHQMADARPAETPTVDISTWARDQMAWVMGDRAREMAALPSAAPGDRQEAPARTPDSAKDRTTGTAAGAVAAGGGWFQDNIVQGWTRHQAAQRLAEPGYRPDLTVAADGR
ncbi:MAG: hypothetical protein CMM61_00780 [Rhodospirillaceae bacterium]|nr:hypothetical protein [Rhodospirillaceae bacterium]